MMTFGVFYNNVLDFANQAHLGQYRLYGGLPYITHPIQVCNLAIELWEREQMVTSTSEAHEENLKIIAAISLLHDVLEDTKETEKHLNELLYPLIPEHTPFIVECVQLLTKHPNKSLIEYLDGIKVSIFANTVKRADLIHNMSDLKNQAKLDKYLLTKYYLEH